MTFPSHAECRARLERVMDESIRQAHGLLQVLQDERQALENRDAAALGIAAENKRECVGRLEALEVDRESAGEAFRATQEPAAAEHRDAGDPVADRWQRFLSIVGRCNELNTSNGAIIRLRRRQVADALKIISGCSTETYGPAGTESLSGSRRTLAAI